MPKGAILPKLKKIIVSVRFMDLLYAEPVIGKRKLHISLIVVHNFFQEANPW